VSTPDDWRVRDILGAYWEELEIDDQLNWLYKTMPACTATVTVGCLTNIATVPGSSVNNPGTRNDNTAFFNDVQRGYRQIAFFTSLDVDLIPKVLTLTGGTRYYRFVNDENGTVAGSFGCYEAGPGPCFASAKNINLENEHTTYTGFKSRANLTWHVSSDVLVYYTWSQGFRPGAFNRTTGCYIPDGSNIAQYCSPTSYASDSLTNNEIGWKSEFLDHRIQWNGAVYQENWNNVQVDFFDPGVLGNVGFDVNGPDYRIRGVETSFIASIAEGLTAQGAASWNSSTQTNSPYLIANNPALLSGGTTSAGEYGKPILSVTNPYGPIGGPSANSPPFQFNLRLRYQWTMNNYNAFAQAGATHTAHSYTQSSANPAESQGSNISTTLLRFENPAYTQYDASLGIGKDAWSTEVYAQNLTNENVSTYTSTNQFVVAQTILRPRVIGVKFRYKF
jgi:outer membrane receptor protein involved in Fe transport